LLFVSLPVEHGETGLLVESDPAQFALGTLKMLSGGIDRKVIGPLIQKRKKKGQTFKFFFSLLLLTPENGRKWAPESQGQFFAECLFQQLGADLVVPFYTG